VITEAENEISNLKHDYAIVSAERNGLRAHAERLAIEMMKLAILLNETSTARDVLRARNIIKEALAAWEGAQK